jgi:peptide/nickel transport system permease protein
VAAYIIRRILQAAITLIIVTLIVFLTIRLLPGDPLLMYISQNNMRDVTVEQLNDLRHKYGLDKSLTVQFVDWAGKAVRGDLGVSILAKTKVANDIKRRLPVSLYLGTVGLLVSSLIGIPAGVLAATRRGTWLDNLITSLGNLGMTIPVFWLGVMLIYVFGLKLWGGILPIFGYTSPFKDFGMSIKQIIMPVFCLAVPGIAGDIRVTRSSMLEVMRQDYIRTAWSKGLKENVIIFRHALKNGLIPIVTLKGMALAMMLGGQVFVEKVFSIPGMGRLAVDSVTAKDYPEVQGIMLVIGLMVLAINLLVDLSYGWLDPRVRYA